MAGRKPGTPKTGGRKKGTPNKITSLLKDEILEAASKAHPQGRVAYLAEQAKENPAAFMTLLGKVLPTQITGEGGGPVEVRTLADFYAKKDPAADAQPGTSRILGNAGTK